MKRQYDPTIRYVGMVSLIAWLLCWTRHVTWLPLFAVGANIVSSLFFARPWFARAVANKVRASGRSLVP